MGVAMYPSASSSISASSAPASGVTVLPPAVAILTHVSRFLSVRFHALTFPPSHSDATPWSYPPFPSPSSPSLSELC
eukprot:766518-Hanusia_phi.AAC.5